MQKLADKINEMWKLNAVAGPFSILSIGKVHYVPKGDDLYNAEFIVWGLERLSELGYGWGIDFLRDRNFQILGGFDRGRITLRSYGESMAQAVYNALCKALEVEP